MTHATPWVARAINDLSSVSTAALNRLPIWSGAGNLSGPPGRWCRPLSKNKAVILMNEQFNPRSAIKALEQKILQSYVFVVRVNKNAQGYRSSTLERHGAHEVRLIDPPRMTECDTIPFWIELFDHNARTTVDSYGGYDLEAVAIAADAFIARARLGEP